MNSFKLTILLHPSIEAKKQSLTDTIDGETKILDGIISVLKMDDAVSHLLVVNDEIKPGYLIISDKRELKTTGIINEKISSDMNIRIIPISHGG